MNKHGFSLVELLIAVSILIILSGMVVLNLMGETTKAREARAKSDIEVLKTALRLYQSDNYILPSQRQGLSVLISRPTTAPLAPNWRTGGYLDSTKIPLDPWGREYIYFSPGRNNEPFEIVSYGEDGIEGGTDISSSN